MSAVSVLILLAAVAVTCTVVALVVGSPIPDRAGDQARLDRVDPAEEES